MLPVRRTLQRPRYQVEPFAPRPRGGRCGAVLPAGKRPNGSERPRLHTGRLGHGNSRPAQQGKPWVDTLTSEQICPAPFWRGPRPSTPQPGRSGKAGRQRARAPQRRQAPPAAPRPRTLAPPAAAALHLHPHALGRAQLSAQSGNSSASAAAGWGVALSLARRDVSWRGGLRCCHGVGSVVPSGQGRARPRPWGWLLPGL